MTNGRRINNYPFKFPSIFRKKHCIISQFLDIKLLKHTYLSYIYIIDICELRNEIINAYLSYNHRDVYKQHPPTAVIVRKLSFWREISQMLPDTDR